MTRRNPFRIIRITAQAVGIVAALALVVFVAWVGIYKMLSEYGPHLLWQIPLTVVIFLVVFVAIGAGCSAIAEAWREAERNWGRKERP